VEAAPGFSVRREVLVPCKEFRRRSGLRRRQPRQCGLVSVDRLLFGGGSGGQGSTGVRPGRRGGGAGGRRSLRIRRGGGG
jgi:hypothetical protein